MNDASIKCLYARCRAGILTVHVTALTHAHYISDSVMAGAKALSEPLLSLSFMSATMSCVRVSIAARPYSGI